MKTFCCQVCGQPVYFENDRCERCGATLGFLPDQMRLAALEETEPSLWRVPDTACAVAAPAGGGRLHPPRLEPQVLYRWCGNGVQHGVCNWMIPADEDESFCVACRLNPRLSPEDRRSALVWN